jgi:hypothetical protein
VPLIAVHFCFLNRSDRPVLQAYFSGLVVCHRSAENKHHLEERKKKENGRKVERIRNNNK